VETKTLRIIVRRPLIGLALIIRAIFVILAIVPELR